MLTSNDFDVRRFFGAHICVAFLDVTYIYGLALITFLFLVLEPSTLNLRLANDFCAQPLRKDRGDVTGLDPSDPGFGASLVNTTRPSSPLPSDILMQDETYPSKSQTAQRIRENQRRSRDRKRQYVASLEGRLKEFEQQGVQANIELQKQARLVLEENRALRSLLKEQCDLDERDIDSYLTSHRESKPRIVTAAVPPSHATNFLSRLDAFKLQGKVAIVTIPHYDPRTMSSVGS
ncbi:hypothetical protein ONZ45_g5904 [Pleurotus djamor]|nr:hypothetical protein ONZ45_g5904 [Pleurotus djamor]